MGLARTVSTWSSDRHTKVGCVITGPNEEVLSLGYNGFPRGAHDDFTERYERPLKYFFMVHSEENAILNAVRHGVCLKGSTLYTTLFPCENCAKSIIQAGIHTVVSTTEHRDNFEEVKALFYECGVSIRWYHD